MVSLSVTKAVAISRRVIGLLPAFFLIALLLPLASATAQSAAQPKISTALLAQMSANPLARIPVIVQLNPSPAPFGQAVNEALAQRAIAILNANGQAFGGLSIVNGAAGIASAAGINAMSLLPEVAAIEEDAVVRPRHPANGSSTWRPGQLTSLYPQEVNAPSVWHAGGTGAGVGVAVLDSGVAPDVDLSGRILASVGFAGAHDPSHPDWGGHGSHIAGTIAGNGARSAGEFTGIAPNANVVDVQVLDLNGNGRVSSVVRGIEWVLAHQAQYRIRIINLSFGAPPMSSYRFDAFAAAAEVAWQRGILVVVAAGNGGPAGGTVQSPAIDPYVISVGSTDDHGSVMATDATLGWWSSWGTPADSIARPDLVAPGRRVGSIYVPNSTLAKLLPSHVVTASNGAQYFNLTGTSMSTAVVSGAAALLLQHQPSLTPDQVKKVLTATAQPFGTGAMPAGSGSGLLDAYAAYRSAPRGSANTGQRMSDGAARELYAALYGSPLAWNSLTYLGTNWSAYTWLNLPWNDPTWDNIAWDNIAWDNIAWDNIAWDNIAWDNIAWDNIAWDNSEWNNIAWDSFSFD